MSGKAVISLTTGLEDPEKVTESTLVENAELGGTVPLWDWIGEEPATPPPSLPWGRPCRPSARRSAPRCP
jgi:hypothetical protein